MAGGLGCFPLGRPTCLVRPGSRPLPLRHSEFDILWQALTPPRKFSALPPRGLDGASPKAVSGRTSYLRVRLEFLPYPHLIPTLFNGCGFGPPMPFTASSSWTWIDHPVSGLRSLTIALLRLGFPSAPRLKRLTSPVSAARRTVLQKVRGSALSAVPQLVNTGFQVLFHSPPGVLFTFPSQYCALSVTGQYSALRGGPRLFRQGFTCPGVLRIPLRRFRLGVRGFHPLRPAFPKPFPCRMRSRMRSIPRSARAAVWAPPVSLAATPGIDVSFFSSGYLDVSVRRVPLRTLWIGARMHGSSPCGFPHSEICGSRDMCSSPQLIAACRVFLRLPVPRHPPCALSAWPA